MVPITVRDKTNSINQEFSKPAAGIGTALNLTNKGQKNSAVLVALIALLVIFVFISLISVHGTTESSDKPAIGEGSVGVDSAESTANEVKVLGNFEGEGPAKAYLQADGKTYTVFDTESSDENSLGFSVTTDLSDDSSSQNGEDSEPGPPSLEENPLDDTPKEESGNTYPEGPGTNESDNTNSSEEDQNNTFTLPVELPENGTICNESSGVDNMTAENSTQSGGNGGGTENDTIIEPILENDTYACEYADFCIPESIPIIEIPENQPPVLTSQIPNQTISVNENITFNLEDYFSDPDGDVLTFGASSVEDISVILIENNAAILIPDVDFAGNRSLYFHASDANSTTESNEVFIFVENTTEEIPENATVPFENYKKIQDDLLFDVIIDSAVIENASLIVNFHHTSPELEQIKIETNETLNYTLSTNLAAQDEQVILEVNDYNNEYFKLRVGNETEIIAFGSEEKITNQPPILIKDIPNQEILIDSSKNINLSDYFSDPDNDTLNFNFSVLDNELTLLSITESSLAIQTNNITGTQQLIVYASDANFTTPSNAFLVNITNSTNATNNPPLLLNNIPDITILENENYSFDLAEYFIDEDGDALTFNSTQPDNITVFIQDTLVTLTPEEDFTGNRSIIFYASDGNSTTESNLVNINVIENISLELVPTKEVFSSTEEPEFKLRDKNSKNKAENNTKPIKANNKLSRGNENLELYLYNEDNLLETDIKIEKTGGEFKISLPREKDFRPGKYVLQANYTKNGQKASVKQYFYWGVLAINTDKSIYLPNETADISIGVLDLAGRVFCLANVTLEITDPNNNRISLTTENGDIRISKECDTRDFTYVPDYSTNYQVNGPGTYQMRLIATTNDGTYSVDDSFEVQANVPFDVSRASVTRIKPSYAYETNITIKANQNYKGAIIEKVPASFEIKTDGKITESNNLKEIEWQVDLKAGDEKVLNYNFDSPDVWPMIFLSGPLQIGSWQETREWQIASDQVANLILLWDNTADAPAGWTCISCSAGNNFYGRFIRGYSSYGTSQGGSATHSHSGVGTLTSTQASASAGGTSTTKTYPPHDVHTHTTTVTSGLSANNLPAFRNLKVIKYDNGVPETLPAGVIAIFQSAPSGWTQVDNDNNYVRGNDTASVNITNGSNTHTHSIVLAQTSDAAAGTRKIGAGATVGGVSHYHASSSGTSVSNSSEPPYVTVILAKKNSAGAIPTGMIGMFDATPPAGQWNVMSNNGGDFYQNFFKPTGTYGTKSTASTHQHTSLVVTTNGPSGTTAAATTGTSYSSSTHTHQFTVPFDVQDQTPVYWDAIFANATSAPAPSLEQIHYHWRNDDGSETTATSATSGTEDTVLADTFTGNKRLRIEISNEGGAAAEDYQYRLEYGVNTSSCGAISTWTDVGAVGSDAWDMYASTNLTEGGDTTNITVAAGGVTDANPVFKTPNTAVKDTSSTLSAVTLNSENFLEMEFSIAPNATSAAYCFRITNASSTTNFVYTTYAGVIVDKTSPTATFGTNPVDYYNSSSTTVIFDAKCSDNVGLSTLQIWANDTGTWAAKTTQTNPTSGTWYNLSVGSLTQANFVWGVKCIDSATNSAFSASNRTITVDTTAPTITLPYYTNATVKKSTDTLTLNIQVTDALTTPQTPCYVSINGGANQTIAYSGGWCNGTVTLNGLIGGNKTIAAYDNDSAGNTGLNNSFVVWIDDTAPTADFGTNPVDNYNSSSQTITFDLKCSDNVALGTLQLWGNWTGTWQANQTNSSPSDNIFWNVAVNNIPQGVHTWAAWCNDSIGNSDWTNTNRTFTVDITAPTVTNTAVNTTGANTTDEICINATVTDNLPPLSAVWAMMVYPNNTAANFTMADTSSDCSGGAGDNIYGASINVGGTAGNLTVNTTYANDTSGNLGYQSPFPNLQVNVSEACAIAVGLSDTLNNGIYWTVATLPSDNQSADENNGLGVTPYNVTVVITGGCTADLYIKADDDLIAAGGDRIGLGNETYCYNTTDSTVPGVACNPISTAYTGNQIGANLNDQDTSHLKFYLNVPSSQAAGTYTNNVTVKGVKNGDLP